MSKFNPRRDPPYFAVLLRTPSKDVNAGQFLDAGERMIGLAAAEIGFLGIEDVIHTDGMEYTICYWREASALTRWRDDVPNHIPPSVNVDTIVCFEGCLWHWLHDVFDAKARVDQDAVVQVTFGEKAA